MTMCIADLIDQGLASCGYGMVFWVGGQVRGLSQANTLSLVEQRMSVGNADDDFSYASPDATGFVKHGRGEQMADPDPIKGCTI